MSTFKVTGLSPEILRGIEDLGFETPTPIQEKVIPAALATDNDIIGLAQTGTGKTAAFGLPILEQIDLSNNTTQALILSPTRELCIQIAKDIEQFSKYMKGLYVVPVYGGARIDTQIRALKRGAHIVVATPGRMFDMIQRKAADVSHIRTVVLDEADEMLNMGFRDELDGILEGTPKEKRTFLFSATMPKEVARIAKHYMDEPVEITVGQQNSGADNVRHIYYQVREKDRYSALKRIADYNPDIYGIVFCRTRNETKDIADKLIKDGYSADALHGDLSQVQRDYVMNHFRSRSLQMLVATDVAARGIDVSDITHVINYNLPEDLEVYTHRSGRTGRADKSGVSIAIVNYREKRKLQDLERSTRKKFEKVFVPSGIQICEKQLFNLIDRMENVVVDEKQIAQFMDAVNLKLESLPKEDIIKRFVSLEFNRFLEYYKNAPDLNEKEDRRDRNDRNDRGDRGGRGRDRDRGGDRRFDGDRRDRGGRRGGRSGFTRFFINIGKKDSIEPKNIIGMINDHAQDRDINVGDIDIKDSFSFFEVGKNHTDKILDSLKDQKYKGRQIRVEVAEESDRPKSSRGGDRDRRGGDRDRRGGDRDRRGGDRDRRSSDRDRGRSDDRRRG